MRGLKSTLALIVVLGGLGAYIYFVTSKQPDGGSTGGDAGKKQEKVFATLQADKIEEVKISTAAGDTTTLKKDGPVWKITQPLEAQASDSEVSGLTSALGQVEIVRIIDENPANLNDYGLSNPRIEIDFKAAGDKGYSKLLVGEKSPTGADMFAKRNDEKKVFLIPAMQETSFNRTTFDLRDKTLLKFERDKVDAIDISAGGKALTIGKDGGEWKLSKPVQTKADFGSVEGLVGRLQTVQMKSIAADNATPADLKKYGLDKPEATVNLSLGSAKATLLFGGKAADNTVYARDASKPSVVTVESALLDDMKKGADDYRRKDVFEFRPFNATHIEITRNGQTVTLDRVKGTGENAPDKWKRVSAPAGDLDKEKSDSLLGKLSNIRAASFVDASAKTGLDKPAMTIVVKFDEGRKEDRAT
ncbi:MAG TPA: DUF4340 domain-containing protein, partial [Vicinamibacterales bacterium]|nr:DUF4340 domain-containing protein [Vicinamibacterales bacterium]